MVLLYSLTFLLACILVNEKREALWEILVVGANTPSTASIRADWKFSFPPKLDVQPPHAKKKTYPMDFWVFDVYLVWPYGNWFMGWWSVSSGTYCHHKKERGIVLKGFLVEIQVYLVRALPTVKEGVAFLMSPCDQKHVKGFSKY